MPSQIQSAQASMARHLAWVLARVSEDVLVAEKLAPPRHEYQRDMLKHLSPYSVWWLFFEEDPDVENMLEDLELLARTAIPKDDRKLFKKAYELVSRAWNEVDWGPD